MNVQWKTTCNVKNIVRGRIGERCVLSRVQAYMMMQEQYNARVRQVVNRGKDSSKTGNSRQWACESRHYAVGQCQVRGRWSRGSV